MLGLEPSVRPPSEAPKIRLITKPAAVPPIENLRSLLLHSPGPNGADLELVLALVRRNSKTSMTSPPAGLLLPNRRVASPEKIRRTPPISLALRVSK